MLKGKRIINYYFSGSGNTRALAETFTAYLNDQGYESSLQRMEDGFKEQEDSVYTLGLIFPVAMQSTYPLVWDFIYALPEGNGQHVFMFDSMNAFSGGIVGPVKRVLKMKGYHCIGAREFRMSSSYNTNQDRVSKGNEMNHAAIIAVRQYAQDLIDGNASWGRIPILSDLMRLIAKSKSLFRMMSKKISIDESCTNCRRCLKHCPVGAISLNEKKIIINHDLCNACMRCISDCPADAMQFDSKPLVLSFKPK